jgi:hypothetical protein
MDSLGGEKIEEEEDREGDAIGVGFNFQLATNAQSIYIVHNL